MTDVIGYTASIFAILMFTPQVVKTVRMKETRDLSIWLPILVMISCFLWIAYGLLKDTVPLVVTNIGILIQAVVLLLYKLKYH